jgi:hypothetical protein
MAQLDSNHPSPGRFLLEAWILPSGPDGASMTIFIVQLVPLTCSSSTQVFDSQQSPAILLTR